MLNVSCPICSNSMKLATPKTGKFAPTCKKCNQKFQLLIKEMPDGTFKYKAAPFGKPKKTAADQENTVQQTTPDETRVAPEEAPASTRVEPNDQTRVEEPATAATDDQDFVTAAPAASSQTKLGSAEKTTANQSKKRDPVASSASGKIGPYRLIKMLGEGGMGSVYLANQTSLDRNVALKVVKANLAKRASMLARFTREAYAAAQLVHPNVVQIYDMGDDKGNCYFSMELVDGMSLMDFVKQKKVVDPEQATRFILHAARGLQCAHNAGMVHRDIKPANLLVSKDGIVKVADLGLVKVPDHDEIEDDIAAMSGLSASVDLTQVGHAIGTPYYMAPEQAKSAITADHRADIYSLGCTYYVLLTGKRPFEGNSLEEVVSKHNSAPIVAPSRVVERVPANVSSIVTKMMAKDPEDRYQTTAELIEALEKQLGISSAEAFTPDEADADLIESSCQQFNKPPLAKLRGMVAPALAVGSIVIAVALAFVNWRWATGMLILPISAYVSYFIFAGSREDAVLYSLAKELVMKRGILAWAKWGFAGLLLVAASFLIGSWLAWLILGLVGVGLGIGYYFSIDLPLKSARASSMDSAEKLIRKMRLKGMDESTIQMFVAKYCGKHWEEFFESLFGYEAKRKTRDEYKRLASGKKKPAFRGWRDPIFDRFNKQLSQLSAEEDQKHLQKVEQAGLEAQGVSADEAREQAAQMAAALVDHGESVRVQQLQQRLLELDPEAQRLQKRLKVKAMLAEARSGKYAKPKTAIQKLTPTLNRFLGPFPRFLLGCCLILGCLMWAKQNELVNVDELATSAQNVINADDTAGATQQAQDKMVAVANKETDPLAFPLLGNVFFNFNGLIAGLILIGSAIVSGWRMAIFMLPATIVCLWGAAFGIPEPIQILHVFSAIAAACIFMAGLVFGRMED